MKAGTIVGDVDDDVVARRVALDRYRDQSGFAVANRIAEAFLDDPVNGRIGALAEVFALRRDARPVLDLWIAPPPEIDQPTHRLGEAEFGKSDRPQAAQHASHQALQVSRRVADRLRMEEQFLRASLTERPGHIG